MAKGSKKPIIGVLYLKLVGRIIPFSLILDPFCGFHELAPFSNPFKVAELPTLPVAAPGVSPQRQVRKTRVLQFRSLTLPLKIGWAPKEVFRGRYVTFREGMYI